MLPAEFNPGALPAEAAQGPPSAVDAGGPPMLSPGSCGELPSVEGGVPEEPPLFSVWECGWPLGWRGDRMAYNEVEAR